jgi:uncharacterized protein (DUF427 family)
MVAAVEPTMTDNGVRVEPGHKRVRAFFAGQLVVDTVNPVLVWEIPHYPAYYLPAADVRTDLLVPTGRTRPSQSRGEAELYTLRAGDREVVDAAARYPRSPVEALRDLVRLDWNAMDAWFEEDEQVYTHVRSPYTRVDILPSSRHVRVELDGVTIADSERPHLLFETGLPVRYYLPKVDVRLDLLRPSDTVTHCPYKGRAEYWSVQIGDRIHPDVVWSYRTPLPESQRIAGLVSFYDDKVDLYVDGVRSSPAA